MLEQYEQLRGKNLNRTLARRLPFMQGEGRTGLVALAHEAGMSLAEFQAHLKANADEVQALSVLTKYDGSGIVDQANLLMHLGMAHLIKALPDADLAEVVEIVKTAKNVKADEMRVELAKKDPTANLPVANIQINIIGADGREQPIDVAAVEIVTEGGHHGE